MISVADVDAAAERLYTSTDNATRQQAQGMLDACCEEGADIALFQNILQESNSQYTLLFTAQGLVRWFKANGKYLDQDQKRDLIVNRCGQCLQRSAVGGAPRHVVMSLVNMYAKLTKVTFEKEPYLTEAVTDVLSLLRSTYGQCQSSFATDGSDSTASGGSSMEESRRLYFLSVVLLDDLVNECSKYDSSKAQTFMNFATHRRCSNNFRDECMLDIFKDALYQLESLTPRGFVTEVVNLVKSCLTFDFMAIMVDETEEALSAQFPSTWKETIRDPRTQAILWGQQRALPYPHCEALLSAMASVCGIRRTFFDTPEDRLAYIDVVLEQIYEILTNAPDNRLTIPHYVNTLAETCNRVIAPFGYRDLHQSRGFMSWVNAMMGLSEQVFATPFGRDGSFSTATALMNFWARLCTSRRMYAGIDEPPSDLEQISPRLALAIFRSRVCLPSSDGGATSGANTQGPNNSSTPPRTTEDVALLETLADDLDGAMEAVLSQAEALGSIAVLEQVGTMQGLANYVQQQLGPSVLNSPIATGWLFFMGGCVVRHVLNSMDDKAMEGCGNFLMFCVDCANHRRLSGITYDNCTPDPATNAALEIFVERGLLFMLAHMQTVFTNIRQQNALSMLVTNIFQSRAQLFQFILNNTGGNILRSPSGTADEGTAEVMRLSIELIGEAIHEVPQSILCELSFDLPPIVQLPLSQSHNTYKLRTNLYHILWPLNLVNRSHNGSGRDGGRSVSVKYTRDVLERFVRPIKSCIQTTMTSNEGTSPIYVAGWLRDLRGVAMALQDDVTNSTQAYCDFIEWFCDEYSVFESIIASPVGESPIVTTSLLRFLIELVNSRGGRMAVPGLGNHTILGLTLFKNLCQFLRQIVERCVTTEKVQQVASPGAVADAAYDSMMKPLSLSMTCLRKCVGDSFVPLGAMWFYGDDTYDATLLGLVRMIGVFPTSLFASYPETTFAVVDLLRTICEDDSYQPLAKLSSGELQVVLNFVMAVCEDTSTQTGALIHSLTFLGFIAGFVKDVKELSTSPSVQATISPSMGSGTPPPPSPMQLPQYYAAPNSGRLSGTPGGRGRQGGGGAGHPPSRLAREARLTLARNLEPMTDVWLRLIQIGMSVIVLQDRALSASCAVVYPIIEAYPPFWQQFVGGFVPTYPSHKQERVREALSALFNDAESSERFFSEVFTFRQTLRQL